MANDSLAHHLLRPLAAGCCSDLDEYDDEEEPASVAFPSFWPPFPALSSDSDSDAASFVRPRMDRPGRAGETAASSFFGLGFHDGDDDEWAPAHEDGGEVELPLCWDCLQLEDHDGDQRWDVGVSDADEWEQVAGREEEEAATAAAASAVRSLEWEVLLAANSLGSLVVDDAGDDADLDAGIETYFLDDADDLLFGQLAAVEADHGPPGKCGRPAAKAAVEALPTVVVAEADAARGDAQCAVCKDGVEAEERARRLPCAHLYHDACILPWLAIRNTCPLCRHELPTDDPEYEKWKARRAAGDADPRGAATEEQTEENDDCPLLLSVFTN
ncbi:hypothetical protein SETIT_1G304500v2 [Setaria italica]|uniref:RING-type E3 ubiquitin transferase n=1 Tax=Setaria italica TaxID=4555 RepID=A0A368PT70_SETIT|nr:hypothetical protein SETIT_1G304500v2 [Setaria italica]